MGRKISIIKNITFGVLLAYTLNGVFTFHKAVQCANQKWATPAGQEYQQILPELEHYKKLSEVNPAFLSEEGKKHFKEVVITLTDKKAKLEEELKPYDKEQEKWLYRGINPLNYLK